MQPINEKNAVEVARTVKDIPVLSPGSVRRSTSFMQLAAAMVTVQKEIEDPVKTKQAQRGERGGSYRYSDLPTVLDVVRPALTRNGLTVVQLPCELDGGPALCTLLVHAPSGEWLETTMQIRPASAGPQNIGSALTYARRYALLALCGIAADDDDGKAGSHQQKPAQQQPQQPKPAQQPVQASEWGKGLATRVALAKSRDEGTKLWAEYETASKENKVNAADKALIDAAFKDLGQRCPKPEQPVPVAK